MTTNVTLLNVLQPFIAAGEKGARSATGPLEFGLAGASGKKVSHPPCSYKVQRSWLGAFCNMSNGSAARVAGLYIVVQAGCPRQAPEPTVTQPPRTKVVNKTTTTTRTISPPCAFSEQSMFSNRILGGLNGVREWPGLARRVGRAADLTACPATSFISAHPAAE